MKRTTNTRELIAYVLSLRGWDIPTHMEVERLAGLARQELDAIDVATEMQDIIGEWHVRTFPNATTSDLLNKLNEEVDELEDANWNPSPDNNEMDEAADCLIVLMALAHRQGFNLTIHAALKHLVNLGRKWDERGHHVE